MKTYTAEFNENNRGVYGISLVHDPAMEGDFIALSKNAKIEFKTVDEEQKILMGLVLEPNKPIYRNQNGEEFNIVFSEQVIKDLSQNFFKQGYQTNSTIEHSGDRIEGVSFVESWIVEDSKIDKSALHGFSYPKGSWLVSAKVDNDEVWEKAKEGEFLGFSIDAFVTLKEVNLKSDIEMAEEKKDKFSEFVDLMLSALSLKKEEKESTEVKLGAIKTAEGDVTIMFDGEALEVGGSVWVEAEDGSKIALPIGEIPLEDGKILVIAEEGVIAEVREAAAEKPAEEEELAAPAAPTDVKEITDAIKSVLIKYSEDLDVKFKEINAKLSEVVKENETLKSQVVTLSEQPASKAIKSTVEQSVKLNKKGRLLAKLRNNK